MKIAIISADTELGLETVKQLVAKGHQVAGLGESKDGTSVREQGALYAQVNLKVADELQQALTTAQPEVVLNLTPQITNTLLHDGQLWQDYDDKTWQQTTSALLKALQNTQINLLIHASYAFLYGNAQNATEDNPLTVPGDDPIFAAAIAAENQVTTSNMPSCLLRLGFLYGPQSEDLKKYEFSFKLHRPYYAGPENHLANFLHYEDAAQALVQVVEAQPSGEVFNIVDGTPVPFATFVDTYALKLGYSKPGHIPEFTAPVAQVIIKPQQMKLLDLSTTVNSDRIRQQLGWTPHYPSYEKGLEQTVALWRQQGAI